MNSWRVSLAVRLFAAQVLALAVGGEVSAEARWHVERAYASVNALALGVGLLAALVAALAASTYATRRIANPVTHFAHASASLANGHYDVRMADPGLGRQGRGAAQ